MSPSQELDKDARHYLPSLTGLRFIAAATIFLGHTLGSFKSTYLGYTFYWGELNALGMPLFFVLSGFIVHYNYAQLFQTKSFGHSSREFLLARFSRIYPLFFFVFIFYLVQDRLLLGWMEEGKALLICSACLLGVFSWYPIYTRENLLLQSESFSVSWSIATEFFFYWAYIFFARPICRLNTLRKALWFFIICILIGYAVQIPGPWDRTANLIQDVFGSDHPKGNDTFLSSHYRWVFYHSPYSRIFEFLLGCATAQLFATGGIRLKIPSFQNIGLWSAVGAIVVLLLCLNSAHDGHIWCGDSTTSMPVRYLLHYYMNFLFAPFMAVLILIFALRDAYFPQLRQYMAHPKLVFLGEISLSLYLMHPLIITVLPVRPDMTFVPVRIFFTIGLIIAISIGTYTLVEVPCRKFFRHLFRINKPIHSPVVIKASS